MVLLAVGLAAVAVAGDVSAPAREEPEARIAEKKAKASEADDSQLFGNGVVGTMAERAVRISLRPHFGDFISEDYLGLTGQARYGLTDDWEVSAKVDVYLGHGLGDVPAFSDPGISRAQVGLRHQLRRQPEDALGVVVGINYSRPVGRPPPAMADAYSHLVPYAVFSRRLESRPEWTVFVKTGLDFVSLVTPSALGGEDGLARDSWSVGPGVNWERGDWSWTLDTGFASTWGLADEDDCRVSVAPSVSWRLPAKWTPGRKGRWVLGFGASVTVGDGETDFGVRGSLRTDFTLRELFRRKAAPPDENVTAR